VTVTLQGADATGFSGSGSATFAGIDSVIGTASAADVLADQTGASAATWTVAATRTYSDGTHTLGFTAFDDLRGGAGADTFVLSAAFTGSVAGGAGSDTLDLSGRTGPVTVTLQGVDGTGFSGSGAATFAGLRP